MNLEYFLTERKNKAHVVVMAECMDSLELFPIFCTMRNIHSFCHWKLDCHHAVCIMEIFYSFVSIIRE